MDAGTVYVGNDGGTVYTLTDAEIPERVGSGVVDSTTPTLGGDGRGVVDPTTLAPIALGALGLGGGGIWYFITIRTMLVRTSATNRTGVTRPITRPGSRVSTRYRTQPGDGRPRGALEH